MTFHTATARAPNAGSSLSGIAKYLTVTLDRESYGLAVLKVREIIRMQKITPVPQMPSHVLGVINLRGRVLPVVDLRVKFGLPAPFTDRTCIVVTQVKRPGGQSTQTGLIVDTVEEVLSIPGSEIESAPDFGAKVETSFILGLVNVKGQVKTLLNLDQIVSPETAAALGDLRPVEKSGAR